MSESEKPLVTFALFAYNQERYIREAVEAALAQDYEPLEIILSDDCSSDKTFEIIQNVLDNFPTKHKVILNRNDKNLGLISHVNKVMSCAGGELVVLAAGDDVSFGDRVSEIVFCYLNNDKPMVIHSKAIEIDEFGEFTGFECPRGEFANSIDIFEAASSYSIYLGASGAWSREMWIKYGEILFPEAYEDLVVGFRAILENKKIYIDKSLLFYRVGVGVSCDYAKNYKDAFELRKKLNKVRLNVVRQRIIDFKKSGIDSREVLCTLKSELARNEFTNYFYKFKWRDLFSLRYNYAHAMKDICYDLYRVLLIVFVRRRRRPPPPPYTHI